MANDSRTNTPDANRDPLTGAAGSHPVGTGVGAVAGAGLGAAAAAAMTRAAAGTRAGGPLGPINGGANGAVVGGLAGKGIAESIDPTREDAYWRDNYSSRPYVESGSSYDDYGPAYGYGVNSYSQHAGRRFEDVEGDLSSGWESARGNSSLTWDRAKHATKDAWHRVSDTVERAVPGDSDRDGK